MFLKILLNSRLTDPTHLFLIYIWYISHFLSTYKSTSTYMEANSMSDIAPFFWLV